MAVRHLPQMLTMMRRYPLTSEVVMKKIEEFNVISPRSIAIIFSVGSDPAPPSPSANFHFRRLYSSATFVPPSTKSRPLSRLCTTSQPSASTPLFGNYFPFSLSQKHLFQFYVQFHFLPSFVARIHASFAASDISPALPVTRRHLFVLTQASRRSMSPTRYWPISHHSCFIHCSWGGVLLDYVALSSISLLSDAPSFCCHSRLIVVHQIGII
jgi:hypothetical protein